MQPPRGPAGRGGVAQPPSSDAAPAAGQTIPDRGRLLARGRGGQGQSTSHPGHGWEMAAGAPSTATLGAPRPQPGQ